MKGLAMNKQILDIALALAGGLALRWAFGLQPIWWLAWLAPLPVLLAALRSTPFAAFGLTMVAALIGSSGNLHYFSLLVPMPVALLITVLSALPWMLAIGIARRIMTRYASPWAVLAYPVVWCAIDTLLAHLHPDTNWGSLAYSQAGFLPAVQVTALAGTAALVFLLSLLPAVLALAVVRGWRAMRIPALCTLALVMATAIFGFLRVPSTAPAQGNLVGMAAIDDFIGPRTPAARAEQVWRQYERHVETLAAQGARVVVLPEKIAVMAPDDAAGIERRMSALTRRTKVWLVLGIGIDDGRRKRNLAWLFAPDGSLDANYQKHHMAPPERDFTPGIALDLRTVGGTRYGLAICKDMHFAAMGRAYGQKQAQAMLVPAWDFGEDSVYAARLSALRGVESGFAMVRAAREGLLTVTDAYGRIVAETRSAPLPGAVLLAHLPVQAPLQTLYQRTGDLFGWLCTGAALLMLALGWRRTPEAVAPPPTGRPVPSGSLPARPSA
jgi:apolipoprotein N-acyltransferase